MEDFNKADVSDLPDLTGDKSIEVASTDQKPASPESQSTESGEPTAPPAEGGQEPITTEGEQPKVEAGGEPPTEETGTQAPVDENIPEEGKESQTPETTPQSNDDFLSEMSEGRIASADDFKGLLSHYDQLKQAVKSPEMLLPEGKAREAFKYAMQFPSDNVAIANQSFHHVMSLNPESMPAKELQFEAYMLKEENADLLNDPTTLRKYFEAEYEKTYGEEVNLDELKVNDPIMFRKHEIATAAAAKDIKELQTKFQSETPENNEGAMTSEELDAYNGSMNTALNDNDGLTINLGENDDEGMNFILDNQEKRQRDEYVRDPSKWIESVVSDFVDEKNDFNTEGFVNYMTRAMNAEKLIELAFQQGITKQKMSDEDEKRNPAGEAPESGAPSIEEPKTELDALEEALNR